MTRIRNISDTARWVAVYRSREGSRPKPLFNDPFAARLAGEEGQAMTAQLEKRHRNDWVFRVRTILIEDFIRQEIAGGVDTVVNLAAGLDARPYRAELNLPPALRWFEVDLPEMIAHKAEVLREDKPLCRLERVALDLRDVEGRRALFARIGRDARKTLVVTEGLLIYLTADGVAALARDLGAEPSFQRWVFDLVSPGAMKMSMKRVGEELSAADSPLQFAPPESTDFFLPTGWRPLDVKSQFKEAGRRGILPFPMNLFHRLPEKKYPGNRPWSGICLMGRV
jgi:methyltransferase (TIGR00027 family)